MMHNKVRENFSFRGCVLEAVFLLKNRSKDTINQESQFPNITSLSTDSHTFVRQFRKQTKKK